MSALTVVAAPLSPARAELSRAIADLRAASAALAEASQPVERLDRAAAAAEAVRDLALMVEAREAAVGAWLLAGGEGDRPVASDDELAARARAELLASRQPTASRPHQAREPPTSRLTRSRALCTTEPIDARQAFLDRRSPRRAAQNLTVTTGTAALPRRWPRRRNV
jgi:hypothetical protein